MKIAVIADDLTGACDTGVQLVNYGIDVSVSIGNNNKQKTDATIFNTDSRDLEKEDAYEIVREISREIAKDPIDILYKKIDSTMRGNIGSELNALYDQFQPDFILITPAHPLNGRVVRDGTLYLNGVELSETEVAKDPKTPVNESNIGKIIQQSSKKPVKHIHYEDLSKGKLHLQKCLADWKKQGISYITLDAVAEDDLKKTLILLESEYSFILCGSAGLINYLPEKYGYTLKSGEKKPFNHSSPIFFVVGSISARGRLQLNHLLKNTDVIGVELNTVEILKGGKAREEELNRVYSELISSFKEDKSCVFYSSNNIEETKTIGEEKGISSIEISNIISNELGSLASKVINKNHVQNLFLTGGDTAQQVFTRLGIDSYQLIGELEVGVPLGKIDDPFPINIMTKAGNFGAEDIMTNAFRFFQNKVKVEIQSEKG